MPGGGVWVAVTREFERDNCVISEILQSDWTIPNRAGVPRKSTKVPRPSFVRESREGLGPRLASFGVYPELPASFGALLTCQDALRFLCRVKGHTQYVVRAEEGEPARGGHSYSTRRTVRDRGQDS